MLGLTWPEVHGALTHFPVALIVTAFVFDVAAFALRKAEARLISFWLLVAAVVMAVPTLATGWITGSELFRAGSAPSIFLWHRAAAFTTAGLAIVQLVWRWKSRDRLAGAALGLTVLLAAVAAGTVGYTGYLGGTMVFNTPSSEQAAPGTAPGSAPAPAAGAGRAGQQPNPDAQLVARGQQLFRSNNCGSCHKINGQGGQMGPDLTHEGSHRPDAHWQVEHLKQPGKMSPGSAMPSFAQLKDEDLKALAAYVMAQR